MHEPGWIPPSTLHPALAVAIAAARRAEALIRAAAADPASLQVRAKRPNDFVTQVDLASESAIVDCLLGAFPDHAVLGEEAQQARGNAASDHVWIVDPLDGTNNFIHSYPAYSVSIALQVRGRIEQAVVLDAVHGDVFHASLGEGAFCNGRRLSVSGRASLAQSLIGTSCPFQPGAGLARDMEMFTGVMARVAGIRRSGSAALDLAWVAAGYCDGFFDRGLKAWDVAAGSLLITEAGGRVGNFRGAGEFLEMRECTAANPALFEALVGVLAPYSCTSPDSGCRGSGTRAA